MYNILNPQPTIDNPYIVEDYPYGFTLRTQMRVYVEKRKGFGMRYVTQTLNPKTGKWNKPKAGNYFQIALVYTDPVDGHVHPLYFHGYDEKEFNEFIAAAGDILNEEPYKDIIAFYKLYYEKRKTTPVKVTVTMTEKNIYGQTVDVQTNTYTMLNGEVVK